MIAGSAVSARRQFGKPVSCWDTSESVNKGLIAHSQRVSATRVKGALRSDSVSGKAALCREDINGCGAGERRTAPATALDRAHHSCGGALFQPAGITIRRSDRLFFGARGGTGLDGG